MLWLQKNKGGNAMAKNWASPVHPKRSDGWWEGRIIIGHKKNGSPIFKSVFGKTQKSTLKQLHLLIDLYRDVDLTEECRMTLGEWLDKWLTEIKEPMIRASTAVSYHRYIDNHIKPHLGNKKLTSVRTADIQKMNILKILLVDFRCLMWL